MSEADDPFAAQWAPRGGAVAGLIATVVMGAAIMIMQLSTLRSAIAGLYGFEGSLIAGWIAHLAHGTLFGVIFSAFLADPGLYRVTEWRWKASIAGVVYAMALAIAGAGIIMPIWLDAAGFPTPPEIPFVTVPLLVWHLIYGLALGGIFPSVEDL